MSAHNLYIPPDILPNILINIHDFWAWCRARYINKQCYRFIRENDYEKLLEFSTCKHADGGVISQLPNKVQHGYFRKNGYISMFKNERIFVKYECTFDRDTKIGFGYIYEVNHRIIRKIIQYDYGTIMNIWKFEDNGELSIIKFPGFSIDISARDNRINKISTKSIAKTCIQKYSIDKCCIRFFDRNIIEKVTSFRNGKKYGLQKEYGWDDNNELLSDDYYEYGNMRWCICYDNNRKYTATFDKNSINQDNISYSMMDKLYDSDDE